MADYFSKYKGRPNRVDAQEKAALGLIDAPSIGTITRTANQLTSGMPSVNRNMVAMRDTSTLSNRSDNAKPPAHMLEKQRYGLKDGGQIKNAAASLSGRRRRLDELESEALGIAAPPKPVEPPKKKNWLGFKDGGKKRFCKEDGGTIDGEGGPTDDKIPAWYSNGEYVLPADTTNAIGVKNLDAIREATHDFVDTKKKNGMANGGWSMAGVYKDREEDKKPDPNQKGLLQRTGESIGSAIQTATVPSRTAARIANVAPGMIAAPIATGIDAFGAGIRTGATGVPYKGREYEARPIFGGPTKPQAIPGPAAPTQAQKEAVVTDGKGSMQQQKQQPDVGGMNVSGVTGPATAPTIPMDYQQAQALSRQSPGERFMLGGDNQYGQGNAEIYARSNLPSGRLNEFEGIGTRTNWENRPENRADYLAAVERGRRDIEAAGMGPNAKAIADVEKFWGPAAAAKLRLKLEGGQLANERTRMDTMRAGEGIGDTSALTRETLAGKQMERESAAQVKGLQDAWLKLDETNDPGGKQRSKLKEQLAFLTGGREAGGKFSPIMGKDEMGNQTYLGAFDERTGTARMEGGKPAITEADIIESARATGKTVEEVKRDFGL